MQKLRGAGQRLHLAANTENPPQTICEVPVLRQTIQDNAFPS
jgi:hypothetical protein